MSPDSAYPSTQRRAWRALTAFATLLAAFSLLVSVWLYTQVQDSRRDSIRMSCLQTNARHDHTIAALDRLLAAKLRDASGQERRRLRVSRQSTVLLITALAPKRDCDSRAAHLTNDTP